MPLSPIRDGAHSESAHEAWAESFLSALPETVSRMLRESARLEDVSAGQTVYDPGTRQHGGPLALILDGLVRISRPSAPGGERVVALRYAHRAEVIGLPIAIGDVNTDVVHAITKCQLLRLDDRALRYFGRTDARVGWALCQELTRLNSSANERLSRNVFQSVSERVAGSLLDMAQAEGGTLVVRASHQNIADAIGSVREVVARAIRQLRDLRLIQRTENGILITAPETLARMAGPRGDDGVVVGAFAQAAS